MVALDNKAKKRKQSQEVETSSDNNQPTVKFLTGNEPCISIAETEIDLSPFNYRKRYSEENLKEFSRVIFQQGIISPITVRLMPSGRYEVVVGERRVRAARMVQVTHIMCIVAVLTDEQVREIQLSENLQRENPHPMDEALGIESMQSQRMNIDEIALRLGKSKAFVFSRLKLVKLIDAFREMFYADKMAIQDAVEIAMLSFQSQQEYFDAECKKWKNKKDFRIENLSYHLSVYKYDLKSAPFDTKDKDLISEAGPCTKCPFNSATLKSLFPDYAKEAVCTNRQCYNTKCTAHVSLTIAKGLAEQPEALLFLREPSATIQKALSSFPEIETLTRHLTNEVTIINPGNAPDKADYTYDNGEDGEEFDEDAYNDAMEEYNSDVEHCNELLKSPHVKKGLMISESAAYIQMFTLERTDIRPVQQSITAKFVQEAIKSNTATPDLLNQEINRIREREERMKVLDKEKVQEKIYTDFAEQAQTVGNCILTNEDLVGARFIIYQSLPYSFRNDVDRLLKIKDTDNNTSLYDTLSSLSDEQHSCLIRYALLAKPDSKMPRSDAGYFLYQMAKASCLNIDGIEEDQQKKAKERAQKQKARTSDLQKRVKKLLAVGE